MPSLQNPVISFILTVQNGKGVCSHLKAIICGKALVTELTLTWLGRVYRAHSSAWLWMSQLTMSCHMFNQFFFTRKFLEEKTNIVIKQNSSYIIAYSPTAGGINRT